MNSILIITGSLPPDICGVGDYTQLLIDGLRTRHAKVGVFYEKEWSLRRLSRYVGQVRRANADVINIQYPTIGYRRSLLPHLLSAASGKAKTVVTLHEMSRARLMGRMSMYLFFLFADRIIFTTDYERQTACRLAPWIKRKSNIIHIGSNIPMRNGNLRDIDVAYFGHICPAKGIEEFASVIDLVRHQKNLNIKVIGQIEPGSEAYAMAICKQLEALGAEVLLNMPADEVSILLSRVRIALLPFPDGMSLRRGSALASMGNGALLLTTSAVSDSASLEEKCLMASDIAGLYEMLGKALDEYSSYDRIRVAGQEFARSFSWDGIVSAYLTMAAAL